MIEISLISYSDYLIINTNFYEFFSFSFQITCNFTANLRIINKMPKGVIAIVGTTGVDKSELGVQLAKALHGEVINGDSMQVYKGLDIITNKMPMEEREGIPHHLMDFLEPHQEYRIKDIHSRDRVPIIVGGTHYYIQSLLWKNSLIKSYDDECDNDSEDDENLNSETDVLYKRLQEVSSDMYFVFYADPKVLDQRLDKRVDNMIKIGLFEELKYLRNKVKNDISYGGNVNYTRGIFQAIDIHSRDRVPIIVGGTHYYIQSLLWKNSLIKSYDDECDNDSEDDENLNSETDVLYKRLQEVDPIMANK
ncbi:IPP transferase-domain-containing protein [Gigaspora rosea]|uniref:IPP transferase-domain-containing protein n=1 Tax=Gigaspora rosea TaxID=44941 RepID=A0A397UCY9_9GLOM|nr:IPP transferase-domain-containing protein [Gigaspora rosea]